MRRPGNRRGDLIEAAIDLFAERGYDRTSTAAVCERAGTSSGTFFHYFPTKLDLLLAVLAADEPAMATETTPVATAVVGDPIDAIVEFVGDRVSEASDPRYAGLVRAIAAVPEPRVQAALEREARAADASLRALVDAAVVAGMLREDLGSAEAASWLAVLTDGILSRAAEDPVFDLAAHVRGLDVVVRRLVARR